MVSTVTGTECYLKEGLETLQSLFFKELSKVVLKKLMILKGGLLIVKKITGSTCVCRC